MLIVCPSCASEYAIDAARIGAAGRQVRCAACGTGWFARNAEPVGNRALAVASPREHAVIEAEAEQPTMRRRPAKAARPRPAQGRSQAGPRRLALAVIAATILLAPAALLFRATIVGVAPEAERLFAAIGLPVNLAGVTLAEVTSELAEEAGARILLTEGAIMNATAEPVKLGKIDLTIESGAGDILYQWTAKPARAELAPGETTRFRARLASPPPDGRRVLVAMPRPGKEASVASR